MAKTFERRRAIKLRRQGKSYSFIKNLLKVSKGTLSSWIKDIELTPAQKEKIAKDAKQQRIESYIKTTRERRRKIAERFYEEEKRALGKVTERELLIAGLFLYLGEGGKADWWRVAISNSNPAIIKFSRFWLTEILGVKRSKIRVSVHLYKDMNIEKEISFWEKITGIPRNQFTKPYIKNGSSKKIDHPTFGHGTCNILTWDVNLKHKIMAAIEVILNSANGRVV